MNKEHPLKHVEEEMNNSPFSDEWTWSVNEPLSPYIPFKEMTLSEKLKDIYDDLYPNDGKVHTIKFGLEEEGLYNLQRILAEEFVNAGMMFDNTFIANGKETSSFSYMVNRSPEQKGRFDVFVIN